MRHMGTAFQFDENGGHVPLPSSFAGFWDFMDPSAGSDRDVGLRVLEAYYNEAKGYPAFKFSTFNDFLAWAERATTLATDIGEMIRLNASTLSEREAVNYVRELAYKTSGQASQGQLIQAAGSGYVDINLTHAVPEITKEVAQGVAETAGEVAQSVGQGVLSTANMLKYLPWILGGAGVLWLVLNRRRSLP